MKELIIVGAGGLGREVFSWAKQSAECGREWVIKGFLDDNIHALDDYDYPYPVLGRISDYHPQESDCFVMGIGAVSTKKKACSLLLDRGARFITLVHPLAVLGEHVLLGKGSVICPHTTLTCNIKVGDFVLVNCNSSMGHDVEVGDWSTISGHCDVTGFCKLGAEVFLGSHASIVPGRKIGDRATVGAGSLVLQHVKPEQTVFGIPAKKIM